MSKTGVTRFVFLVFILVIFSLAFTTATLSIVPRASCTNEKIIIGLSSLNNAHGEIAPGSYPYVLCDDVNNRPQTCSNSIIKLSSVTNAHGEIPSGTNYNNIVCAENLLCGSYQVGLTEIGKTCEAISSANSEENTIETISLSGSTNAHIGQFGYYTTKICCRLISTQCPAPDGIFVYPNILSPTQGAEYNINQLITFSSNGTYALSCSNSVATRIDNLDLLTYKWTLDGGEIDTRKEFQKSFTINKAYEIILTATYQGISNSTPARTFFVRDCILNGIKDGNEQCDGDYFGLQGNSNQCNIYNPQFESGVLECDQHCKIIFNQCQFPVDETPTTCGEINDMSLCESFERTYAQEINSCTIEITENCNWNPSIEKCELVKSEVPNENDPQCQGIPIQYCEYSSESTQTCNPDVDFIEINYVLQDGTSNCKQSYSQEIPCNVTLVPFFTLINIFSVIGILIVFYTFIILKKKK